MDNVKFDTYRENIKEIWEAIGAIKACISIIEGKIGIDHSIDHSIESWVKQKRKQEKEDYYNDVCIDNQYGTVSKYNPIRSLDNPPPECLASWESIRNDLLVPSTQACDIKENHYNE